MLIAILRWSPWVIGGWMLAFLLVPGPLSAGRKAGMAPPNTTPGSRQGVGQVTDPVGPDTNPATRVAEDSARRAKAHIVTPLREAAPLTVLETKPLYEFNELEVDAYLKELRLREPDPIKRLLRLARKNIGQPYEIFLLGEFPFELHDPDPLYCLDRSDCVTFCEHMYAMSFAHDWPSFFALLQRLRYKDGRISMETRNHETVVEWDRHNAWLFEDVTMKLGGGVQWVEITVQWKPSEFFRKAGLIVVRGEEEPWPDTCVPRDRIHNVLEDLADGDFINVIKGDDRYQYASHVGMITHDAEGNVQLLHSSRPQVKEEPLLAYVQRQTSIRGMKFLRLRPSAQAIIDGEMARACIAPVTWAR